MEGIFELLLLFIFEVKIVLLLSNEELTFSYLLNKFSSVLNLGLLYKELIFPFLLLVNRNPNAFLSFLFKLKKLIGLTCFFGGKTNSELKFSGSFIFIPSLIKKYFPGPGLRFL